MKVDFSSVPQRDQLTVRFFTKAQRKKVPAKLSGKEFSAKENSLLHLHHRNLLCVGVGTEANAHTFREAAGSAVKFARGIGHTRLALDLREWGQLCEAAVTGAILGSYQFDEFVSERSFPIRGLRCIVPKKELSDAKKSASRGRKIADAANVARSLANLPGNVIYPETLAQRAREIATKNNLRINVLDEQTLRAQGFGAMIAVGSGSIHPPCLIVLEHAGGGKGERPLVLVGKAVTFDSGGISIKPWAQMEAMIFDKCGGMAVIGAMAAIAQLGIERNVIGVVPSAENLPSATAFRPGDIVKSYDGTHVEIVTTDAEGRLILADAISYARKVKNAAAIIDLATLTGACGIALGEHAAGLWSTSETLKENLLDAAQMSGERLWPMPLFAEYEEQNRSHVADIKNSGGKLAGACTGAAFLKKFADDTPFAHLDIAYTASTDKERPYLAPGATGFGVRLLVELIENWTPS